MSNTKVKWFDEDYDLGADISKLIKLGFKNTTWKDDIAPSFSNHKLQIFFLNRRKFKDHEGRSKFSINKIDEHGETIKHLYETDHFYKVLQLAELSNEY
tara:strand:+ start:418 stop:714 length:297 start_codon:yes stop_codon:yes gene_type:complete